MARGRRLRVHLDGPALRQRSSRRRDPQQRRRRRRLLALPTADARGRRRPVHRREHHRTRGPLLDVARRRRGAWRFLAADRRRRRAFPSSSSRRSSRTSRRARPRASGTTRSTCAVGSSSVGACGARSPLTSWGGASAVRSTGATWVRPSWGPTTITGRSALACRSGSGGSTSSPRASPWGSRESRPAPASRSDTRSGKKKGHPEMCGLGFPRRGGRELTRGAPCRAIPASDPRSPPARRFCSPASRSSATPRAHGPTPGSGHPSRTPTPSSSATTSVDRGSSRSATPRTTRAAWRRS